LFALLQNLSCLSITPAEIIIVDSGEQQLSADDLTAFPKLNIVCFTSKKSVCIQRNIGISKASSPWIFLCDDDIEIQHDYLNVLIDYIDRNPQAGAVSGLWLQKENNEWHSSYPISSSRMLAWKYIFQLGIWGEIKCKSKNFFIKKVNAFYKAKGNHISKAGWPVNTDFAGDYSTCPVYSLGAALIRKEWLLQSPYDEVLDPHGIGDNYGVIAGFPIAAVHVVHKAFVYHHREETNRLKESLAYYRRVLALDYFIHAKKQLKYVKRYRLLWSLTGNLFMFLYLRNKMMLKATIKSMIKIALNRNPYMKASKEKRKVVEPAL
jgi:glycosyltransferase involved in cell wall biosynthesis